MADSEQIRRALAPAVTARRLYGTARQPLVVVGTREGDRSLGPLKMQALLAVALEPDSTTEQLAELLAVPHARLRGVLQDLQSEGWLETTPSARDARVRHRKPTRSAWSAINGFLRRADTTLQDLAAD